MAATLREYWGSIGSELAMADYGAAMVWTAQETYTLTEIRFRMANSSPAYNGDMTIDLYSVSGDEPDTKITTLWSGSVSSWGTIMSYRIFSGLSQSIVNGTQYAYVINLNPLRDATHYIRWSGKSGYANGISYQENVDEVYTDAGIDWHFANYGTPAVPTKATNPSPANNATEVDFSSFGLSWDDGGGADTFDVYIGTTGNLTKVSSAQAGTTYTTSLAEVQSVIGSTPINQKIYWRIDSTNDSGTTTGDEWNFDPRPAKVSTQTPAADATGWLLNSLAATWESPSANTTSYDLSFGTVSGSLSLVDNTSELTLNMRSTPFPLLGTTYYYRLDAVNQFGTTQGDEIAFTTLIQKLVSPTYYYYPFYYRLLPGGSHPPTGVEDTDYVVVGAPNFISTSRILVAIANNKFWYEDI